MVDFYLLTLLASNKDAESYEKVRYSLSQDFTDGEARENAIEELYRDFTDCVQEVTAHHFSGFSSRFFVLEKDENGNDIPGRYRYPYFNNSFLKKNYHNEDLIKDYIADYLEYESLWGFFIKDEPSANRFDEFNFVKKVMAKAAPDHQIYINLFPVYAQPEQLGNITYRNYIKQYLQKIDTDYICYDYYPLIENNDGTTSLYESFLYNMDLKGIGKKDSELSNRTQSKAVPCFE